MWKGYPISSKFCPLVGSRLAPFLGHTFYLLVFPAGFSGCSYAYRHVQNSSVSQLLYCQSPMALCPWHPPLLMLQSLPPCPPLRNSSHFRFKYQWMKNPSGVQFLPSSVNASGRAGLSDLPWCPGCGGNVRRTPGQPSCWHAASSCMAICGPRMTVHRQRGRQTRRSTTMEHAKGPVTPQESQVACG